MSVDESTWTWFAFVTVKLGIILSIDFLFILSSVKVILLLLFSYKEAIMFLRLMGGAFTEKPHLRLKLNVRLVFQQHSSANEGSDTRFEICALVNIKYNSNQKICIRSLHGLLWASRNYCYEKINVCIFFDQPCSSWNQFSTIEFSYQKMMFFHSHHSPEGASKHWV